MRNAVDASYARPAATALAALELDALFYTGAARPDAAYLADLRAHGVAVTLIQESDPNRSQQGFAAGVADAMSADQRASEVGYPLDASIVYVVSDGNAGDPNSGAGQIGQYAAGVQSVSHRPFFFYGNQYACDAALAGAPQALGSWIPSSWGAGTLLTQEANLASPLADTDLNTVHAAYGAWGQTSPVIPVVAKGDAVVYQENKDDGTHGYWIPGTGGLLPLAASEAYAYGLAGVPFVEYPTLGIIGLGARLKAQLKAALV